MVGLKNLIPLIQVTHTTTAHQSTVEPTVKKYYQREGHWYAVLKVNAHGSETDIHVALPS